jgi:hypothetical protein
MPPAGWHSGSTGTSEPTGTIGPAPTAGSTLAAGPDRGTGHTGSVGPAAAADTVRGADSAGSARDGNARATRGTGTGNARASGDAGARPVVVLTGNTRATGDTRTTGTAGLRSPTRIARTGALVHRGRDPPPGLITGPRVGSGARRRAIVRLRIALGGRRAGLRAGPGADPLGFGPLGV